MFYQYIKQEIVCARIKSPVCCTKSTKPKTKFLVSAKPTDPIYSAGSRLFRPRSFFFLPIFSIKYEQYLPTKLYLKTKFYRPYTCIFASMIFMLDVALVGSSRLHADHARDLILEQVK